MTWSDTFSGSYLQGLIANALPHELETIGDPTMTREHMTALFTVAGITVHNAWQIPNGYVGVIAPLTPEQIENDTPGTPGIIMAQHKTTEGIVRAWMTDYTWRYNNAWWLVKTPFGLVTIGWRKRVINIDWSETEVRTIVTEHDVTKSETNVHAWSDNDAITYLTALRQAAYKEV